MDSLRELIITVYSNKVTERAGLYTLGRYSQMTLKARRGLLNYRVRQHAKTHT